MQVDTWSDTEVDTIIAIAESVVLEQTAVRQDVQYLQVIGLVLIVALFAILANSVFTRMMPSARDLTGD